MGSAGAGCDGWRGHRPSSAVPWAVPSSPGAVPLSPVHLSASPPASKPALSQPSCCTGSPLQPPPAGLLSAVLATGLGMSSCSWESLTPACRCCSWRAGACFHLPAAPGMAGEIVPVVLCHTWEAYSACRGLGFIFYISLASVHAYFLMLVVA